jgi:hypothetical protein
MLFDSELVSLVPVYGKFISLEDIQSPVPAKKTSDSLRSELYEIAFPRLCSPTSDKKAVVSALPATYPTFSPNSPWFSLGAPLKSPSSPYSEKVADFGRRSGRLL